MIDFVITWVDGNDSEWKTRKDKYKQSVGDNREARYRNWELLKYWFRGVEKFAPWVNKIHFVTEGHLPSWLNTLSPKLNIVKHSDIIDKRYLPVFNSRAIEVNLHKIKGLSDKFVYFNDDFYLINHLDSSFFFKNGLPCEMAVSNVISGGGVSDAILEAINIINRYFNKRDVFIKKISKWFNLKYGPFLMRTLLLAPWPNFTGFYENHMPMPFLKKTFITLWELEPEILTRTTSSKFRCYGTVNPYLFKYWQFVEGNFYPFNSSPYVKMYQITEGTINNICRDVAKQKRKIIVLNDTEGIKDVLSLKEKIHKSFESILPKKSLFEI